MSSSLRHKLDRALDQERVRGLRVWEPVVVVGVYYPAMDTAQYDQAPAKRVAQVRLILSEDDERCSSGVATKSSEPPVLSLRSISGSDAKSDPTDKTSASPTAACSSGSRGGEPPATVRGQLRARTHVHRATIARR